MVNTKNHDLIQATNTSNKVLILFSAEWCGPCKIIKSNLEKIENELRDEYKIVKVDISENVKSTKNFGIKNVPTVVLVDDKKEIGRFIGARTPEQIKKFLFEHTR